MRAVAPEREGDAEGHGRGTGGDASEHHPWLDLPPRERFAGGGPDGVALLLHGGKDRSRAPVPERSLAVARMQPFAAAILRRTARAGHHGAADGDGAHAAGPGALQIAVARMRYRHRGWNGAAADPVPDTEEVLARIAEAYGPVPVVLVGHSMGGRAALRAAGAPHVVAVAALAPWIPDGEPLEQLRDRDVLVVHGLRDRTTSARASARFASELRGIAHSSVCVQLRRSGHPMLRRSRVWHDLAAEMVVSSITRTPPGGALADAIARGADTGCVTL